MGWLSDRKEKKRVEAEARARVRAERLDRWLAGDGCGWSPSLDGLYSHDPVERAASGTEVFTALFRDTAADRNAVELGGRMFTAISLTHATIVQTARKVNRPLRGIDTPDAFIRACGAGILYERLFTGEFSESVVVQELAHSGANPGETLETFTLSHASGLTYDVGVWEHRETSDARKCINEIAHRENALRHGAVATRINSQAAADDYRDPFIFGAALAALMNVPWVSRLPTI